MPKSLYIPCKYGESNVKVYSLFYGISRDFIQLHKISKLLKIKHY